MTRETRYRLRSYFGGCLGGCFWGIVASVGAPLALVVIHTAITFDARQKEYRQEIIDRFKEADPDAKIRIDERRNSNINLQDLFGSTASIILFRSDEPTMKAFLKKWGFTKSSSETIDSYFQGDFKFFNEQDLIQPAEGHYRILLHKKVATYYRQGEIGSEMSYATTKLYWDAQTGTGIIYVHHPGD